MMISRRRFASSTFSLVAIASSSQRCLASTTSASQINVKSCGAVGDGVADDTQAFAWALLNADEVIVPAAVYSVGQISVPAGKTLITDGLSTAFRQRSGMPSGTAIVLVTGSNVRIGSFSAEGNIDSDPGQWMPAISVIANDRTGDLSDIVIGDVVGRNLRGDVLYLGSRAGYKLSRVKAGNISGDNVYRNVVSITGTGAQGGDIAIKSITGTRVGLFHLDIEPETVPVVGVTVGSIKGHSVSVSGQSAAGYVTSVSLGVVDLSPTYGEVSVADPLDAKFVRPHAYQQRNATGVSIGNFRARGFDGQAILFVESSVPSMMLQLKTCDIEDCSKNDGRNALIMGQKGVSTIRIDRFRVNVPANKMAMLYCDGSFVGSVNGILGNRAGLINNSSGSVIRSLKLVGNDSYLASNTTNTLFARGSAPMGTIGFNCDRLQFEDMTITGVFRGGSTSQQHELTRTVLNNVYFEHTILAPLQANPATPTPASAPKPAPAPAPRPAPSPKKNGGRGKD